MRLIWVLGLSFFAAACSNTLPSNVPIADTADDTAITTVAPVITGVSSIDFYSTFMDEEAKRICSSAHILCSDDVITPSLWFDTVVEGLSSMTVHRSNNQSDYEILIASQLRSTQQQTQQRSTLAKLFPSANNGKSQSIHSEITIQWRGFALNTYHTSSPFTDGDALSKIATQVFKRWQNHAAVVGIFSRDFLYSSLKASDYRNELILPSQLGEFFLEDTQLYADPFRGAVARYRHPRFENAILDVNVSPILSPLAQANKQWLLNQIYEDFKRAEKVSESRNLVFGVDENVSPITLAESEGHYFSVHAIDEFEEPLYAATYLFRQEDKLVKFTSSFPHSVAIHLIEEVLTTLKVPGESELMLQMRSLF